MPTRVPDGVYLEPLVYFLLSVFLLILAAILCVVAGAAISLTFVAALAILCTLSPWMAFTNIVVFIVFQNTVISVLSPYIDEISDFSGFQGANYVYLIVTAATVCVRQIGRGDRRSLVTAAVMAVFALYAAYGAAKIGIPNAAAYFRLFTIPVASIYMAIRFANVFDGRYILSLAYIVLFSLFALSSLEIVFPYEYYELFNADTFFRLKSPLRSELHSVWGLVNNNVRSLFNLTGDYRLDVFLPRYRGVSMHNISSAYIFACLGLIFLFSKNMAPYFVCLIFCIAFNSKGAIFLQAFPVIVLILHRRALVARVRHVAYLALCYSSLVFIYGYVVGDVHVIGLLNGMKSLVDHVIGYGLGIGGNLSATKFATDGETVRAGNFSFAVESAIGVLFYQMGVVSFIPLYYVYVTLRGAGRVLLPIRKLQMSAVAFAVGANGLFQEEAFAPAAAGLAFVFVLTLIFCFAKNDVLRPKR